MIAAPTAPMAPAWLTVATPMMIEPSTANIRARGGTRASVTLIMNCASYLLSKRTGGADLGWRRARIRIYAIYRMTRMRPGIRAPRNMSPALVDVRPNSDGMENWPVACL